MLPAKICGIVCALGLLVLQSNAAAAPPVSSAEDYARADAFLRWNAERLVRNDAQGIAWSRDSDRFWYRVRTDRGVEVRWFDVAQGRHGEAFDPNVLAKLLAEHGCPVAAADLPLADYRPAGSQDWAFTITAGCRDPGARAFVYAPAQGRLSDVALSRYQPDAMSPDGRFAAVAADYNLSLRRVSDGVLLPLSRGGQADDYIGSPPDICCRPKLWGRVPDVADVLWSRDGTKILTYRADTRAVRKGHVLTSLKGLGDTYPRPLPGDAVLPTLHPLILETATGRNIPVTGVAPFALSASNLGVLDAQWSADGRQAYILSMARDVRAATLFSVDAASGGSRQIFGQKSTHPLSVGEHGGAWRVSRDGGTLLWAEQPTDATRLARYDLRTGRRLGFVSPETLQFRRLLRWDEDADRVYFLAQGVTGLNPYYRQVFSARTDGRDLRRLTPEPLDHDVTLSPDARLFVDVAGSSTVPNRTLLRRMDGSLVATIEEEDASRLLASGWRAPTPVTTRDARNRFTLYGLLYLPANFDPARHYPLLDLIYPGPNQGPTRVRTFTVDASGNPQSLAQLGIVVLALDASGTAGRGRAFQEAWHTDLANLGIADHVVGIRQLADRYGFIDRARVGIIGASAGGDAAARAMFTYPDVFKVGVSIAGAYDYRQALSRWGERYVGLLQRKPDGSDNYPAPTWQKADQLQGKFLIAFGGRDDNVNPAVPMAMIDALVAADKPFETIMIPGQSHWPWETPWFLTRSWDFLVSNLRGETPPTYTLRPLPPDPGDAP